MKRTNAAVAMVAVIALLFAGCARTEEDIVGGEGEQAPTPTPDVQLSLQFEFEEPLRSGQPVEWVLILGNEGERSVNLDMPSGQKGDVALTQDGEEVYRWSEDRAFTMALVTVPIEAGGHERFTLEEDALDVEPGTYELVASSTAEPAPEPVRITVTVEE